MNHKSVPLAALALLTFASSPSAVLAQETIEIDQILESESILWNAAKDQNLDDKQRQKLGLAAFGSYLEDLLLKTNQSSTGLSRSEFKSTLQKLNKKFVTFVPTYQVTALEKSFQIKVKLNVASQLLLSHLKKEGVAVNSALHNNAEATASPQQVNASLPGNNNTKYTAPAGNNESSEPKSDTVPYASFLFDEKNRTIYVTPPKAISQFVLDKTDSLPLGYKLKPAALRVGKRSSDALINSLDTALDERATLFSQRVLGGLHNPKLVTRPTWAADVLKFILTSAGVEALKEKPYLPRIWPLSLPWTFSTLYDNPGIVSVFVVRSDDKAGTLERAELVGFSGAHFTRHAWSRAQNDPTYLENSTKALDRIGSSFTRAAKQKKPQLRAQNLEFFMDKSLGDREIISIESIVRPFALGHEHLLIPKSVDAKGIRYSTPLGAEQTQKILAKVNLAFEKSGVIAESSRSGFIEIIPKSEASEKPKAPSELQK
jgi:hypothetical protein